MTEVRFTCTIQNKAYQIYSSQPISWLITEETKSNTTKAKSTKMA